MLQSEQPEDNTALKELLEAVTKQFGAGKITDIVLFERDSKGVINKMHPIISDVRSTQQLVNRLLDCGEACKSMATDLINSTLNKN